jgi:hypothetical protein
MNRALFELPFTKVCLPYSRVVGSRAKPTVGLYLYSMTMMLLHKSAYLLAQEHVLGIWLVYTEKGDDAAVSARHR